MDRFRYYDRGGQPISLWAWAQLMEAESNVVKQDRLQDGTVVSTVWLGLDHRVFGDGLPLIFETMVFPTAGDWHEQECHRYSTEAGALAGLGQVVAKIDEALSRLAEVFESIDAFTDLGEG